MPGALLRFILKAYVYEYCHLFLRMQLRNLCMRVHTRMHAHACGNLEKQC